MMTDDIILENVLRILFEELIKIQDGRVSEYGGHSFFPRNDAVWNDCHKEKMKAADIVRTFLSSHGFHRNRTTRGIDVKLPQIKQVLPELFGRLVSASIINAFIEHKYNINAKLLTDPLAKARNTLYYYMVKSTLEFRLEDVEHIMGRVNEFLKVGALNFRHMQEANKLADWTRLKFWETSDYENDAIENTNISMEQMAAISSEVNIFIFHDELNTMLDEAHRKFLDINTLSGTESDLVQRQFVFIKSDLLTHTDIGEQPIPFETVLARIRDHSFSGELSAHDHVSMRPLSSTVKKHLKETFKYYSIAKRPFVDFKMLCELVQALIVDVDNLAIFHPSTFHRANTSSRKQTLLKVKGLLDPIYVGIYDHEIEYSEGLANELSVRVLQRLEQDLNAFNEKYLLGIYRCDLRKRPEKMKALVRQLMKEYNSGVSDTDSDGVEERFVVDTTAASKYFNFSCQQVKAFHDIDNALRYQAGWAGTPQFLAPNALLRELKKIRREHTLVYTRFKSTRTNLAMTQTSMMNNEHHRREYPSKFNALDKILKLACKQLKAICDHTDSEYDVSFQTSASSMTLSRQVSIANFKQVERGSSASGQSLSSQASWDEISLGDDAPAGGMGLG